MSEQTAVEQRQAINFRGSVHDRAISLRDAVLVADSQRAAVHLTEVQRLDNFYQQAARLLDQMYASTPHTPQEVTLLNNIKDIERSTLATTERLKQFITQNDFTAASRFLQEHVAPAYTEWLKRINQLIDYQETAIQQQVANAADGVIEYKAKDEKYVVNVFTDPTCGYCRKLHNEMQDYNNAGITVRYLAFPRGGVGSETYLQMQHIWCTKDSRGAMDAAKDGDKVKPAMCANPVKQQYELGQSFGINGTPAIILPNGRLIPGYQPAKALLAQLEAKS